MKDMDCTTYHRDCVHPLQNGEGNLYAYKKKRGRKEVAVTKSRNN